LESSAISFSIASFPAKADLFSVPEQLFHSYRSTVPVDPDVPCTKYAKTEKEHLHQVNRANRKQYQPFSTG
jgi:hypothetical protein